MRTAVIRINVDPGGELSADEIRAGVLRIVRHAAETEMDIVNTQIELLPPLRRELEFLVTTADVAAMQEVAAQLSAEAFGVRPAHGVLTYISRGTDDDARGVLAAFKLTGDISRTVGDDGLDIVWVRLATKDLERIPESRVQTALEASLNCEVRIIVT